MDRKQSFFHNLIKAVSFPLFVAVLVGCSEQNTPLTTIKLGIAVHPPSALLFIALEKGYFLEEGIKVEASYYPSGKRAMVEGLLTNQVDIITTADIPFVWKSFSHDDLAILTSLYTADNVNRIIARKDAGIEQFTDLSGKRIATQKHSAVHYFLHSVLLGYEIPRETIQFTFLKAGQLPRGLAAGDFDAFSMREPYISQAVELLGRDQVTILASPGLYVQSDLLVSRKAYLEAHEEVNQGLLRALVKAERFTIEHPDEAMEIVARTLGTDMESLEAIWNTFDLKLNLEHMLLSRLEKIAEWLVEERLVETTDQPDYLQKIYTQPLQRVKPNAMTLIR